MYRAAVMIVMTLCKLTGHIQISQIPDRHEPNDEGTINFTSFFKSVKEMGYDGWFAGEYYAAGTACYNYNLGHC